MYSQGETFYHDIEDEEYELSVLATFLQGEEEYLIAEDFDGSVYAFVYDEDEDDIFLIEDEDEVEQLISYWKNEYMDGDSIADFEDDEYYDREDQFHNNGFEDEDLIIEDEDFE